MTGTAVKLNHLKFLVPLFYIQKGESPLPPFQVPLIVSLFRQLSALLENARVVNQNVNATEFLNHFGEHRRHLFFFGHIRLDQNMIRNARHGRESRLSVSFVLLARVVDGDLRPFLREPDRDRPADS